VAARRDVRALGRVTVSLRAPGDPGPPGRRRWPSRPLDTAPDSEYGGSQDEQAAFADRFLELIDGLAVPFALWSFQHDLGTAGGPAFDSVALRQNDGTPKPVLDVWSAAATL
jgi:hypothetical protein